MEQKLKYESPVILEQAIVELESEILSSSVVIEDEVTVETTGQEVITIDASEFTSNWE